MTFKDLNGNDNLFLHYTLTDMYLFVKKPEFAKRLMRIMDERALDTQKDDVRRIRKDKSLSQFQKDAEITKLKQEYGKQNMLTILDEFEDLVDVDKYLLTGAYRMNDILRILENPTNRKHFPRFDAFMPYRRTFADSIKEISRLLEGRDVKIEYKADNGPDPSGYWDYITLDYRDVDFSTEALAKTLENGPASRALLLPDELTEDKHIEKPISAPTEDERDFRRIAEAMASNNPNIKLLNVNQSKDMAYKGLPVTSSHYMSDREVLRNTLSANGIMEIGKNRFLASFRGIDVELSREYAETLKDGMKNTLREYRDSLTGNFSAENAIDIFYKLDPILQMSLGNDAEVAEIVGEITSKIRYRFNTDEEFLKQYLSDSAIATRYLRETINYKNAEEITPKIYIKKYGTEDAVRKKYDELKRMHMSKMIILYSNGIASFDLLKEDGTFNGELSHKELFDYLDAEVLTADDIAKAITAAAGKDYKNPEVVIDHIKEAYLISKQDKKKRNNSVVRRYFDILPDRVCLEMFVDNPEVVSTADLKRKKMSSEAVANMSRDYLFRLLKSSRLPKELIPTDEDLIQNLGITISGKDILELAKTGFIAEENVLKAYSMTKSLRETAPEKALDEKDLLDFYDVDRLLKLEMSGKLNKGFVERFKIEILDYIEDTQKEAYFAKMVDTLKIKNEDTPEYLNTLYKFKKLGLFDIKDISKEFSDEKVEELVLLDLIQDKDVLELYKDGLVSKGFLKEMYSENEIEALIRNGSIDIDAITLLEKGRGMLLNDLLQAGKIDLLDVFSLYINDKGIEFSEFEEAIQNRDLEDGVLAEFITEEGKESKIEELFKKYYISEDDLSNLVSRGIIEASKAKELSEYLNSHQEFERIFGTKRHIAKLTEVTEGTGEGHAYGKGGIKDPRKSMLKIDPELQRDFIKVLGADERIIYLSGAGNSLDGYEVYGIEDLGVMIFGKFDKPNNSTYIMTVAQGSYFLRNLERRAMLENDGLVSAATKQDIRAETEHVKIKNASKGWAKNIVKAIKELSPKAEKKLKDKKYKSKIDELAEEISVDYELRREG